MRSGVGDPEGLKAKERRNRHPDPLESTFTPRQDRSPFSLERPVRQAARRTILLAPLLSALFPDQAFCDTLPRPVRAGIFLDCGGSYSVKALFDHPFASGSTQVVGNSGFESPSIGNADFVQYPSATLGAWSVTNIDVVSTGYMAPDSGNQSIDLNMNTAGSIQQTLPTTVGQAVVLRLSYTYNNQCFLNQVPPLPTQYLAEVVWNGVVVDTIQVAAGAPRVWQTYSKSLVARGNDVIEIRSLTPGTCGNMLDDITVTTTAVSSQVLGNSTVTLRLPNGTVLPPITVPSSAVTFDAAGTMATIPLGRLPSSSAYKGTLSVQVSDGSGTWTTESVAVDDSVGPWMDSARLVQNLVGSPTDSVYFWTSEPIGVGTGWSFLVDRLGSNGAPSTSVSDAVSLIDSSRNEYLAVLPSGELRPGDSLRLNPAAVTDASGNPALDCDRDVPLETLARSATSTLPRPVRAGLFLDCGGDYSVKAFFDPPFLPNSSGKEFVVNGGFEEPQDSVDYTYSAYTGSLPGWTSVSDIDIFSALKLGPGYDVPEGTQAVDLNGANMGWISQTLATPSGVVVRLSLKYTFNLNPNTTSPALKQARILWNGVPVDTLAWDAATEPMRTWKIFTMDLVTTGNDVLSFASLTGGNAGIMLDDISVTTTAASSQVFGTSTVTLRLPNGTVLPPITVPSSAVTFDAAGTTATIPLGRLPSNSAYKGTLSVQVADGTGTWTTEAVAVDDSVGPWMDSARIVPNSIGGTTDSVVFWTSEPIAAGAGWTFLVDERGSGGAPSIQVSSVVSVLDPAADEYLALVPTGELRAGDSLRLNPAAVSDALGNPALDCDRDVLLGTLAGIGNPTPLPPPPPLRIQIQTHPFLDDTVVIARAGAPVQIWVRRLGDAPWQGTDGFAVADTGDAVGATITANIPLGGTVYIVDNEGVFVVSGDLSLVRSMAAQDRLPVDSSGAYQIKIAWDGRMGAGKFASSGIYVVRLVLLYSDGAPKRTKVINKLFRVGIKRRVE